jgi:hypothetical protein
MAVDPHVHIGFVSILANVLAVIAVIGTLHLLALTANDNRFANAWLSLGF